MDRRIVRRTARGLSVFGLAAALLVGLSLSTGVRLGQAADSITHTIYLNAMEVKGATSAEKLAPPSVNPADISKGYGYKAPGKYDKKNSKKWQVASYMWSPNHITVQKGDTVKLVAFVINGNEHEVYVADPDGNKVVPPRKWNRGREYTIQFAAKKAGIYQLICGEHAPSMTAEILVLDR